MLRSANLCPEPRSECIPGMQPYIRRADLLVEAMRVSTDRGDTACMSRKTVVHLFASFERKTACSSACAMRVNVHLLSENICA